MYESSMLPDNEVPAKRAVEGIYAHDSGQQSDPKLGVYLQVGEEGNSESAKGSVRMAFSFQFDQPARLLRPDR